jgi:hypothetical protein
MSHVFAKCRILTASYALLAPTTEDGSSVTLPLSPRSMSDYALLNETALKRGADNNSLSQLYLERPPSSGARSMANRSVPEALHRALQ